MRARGSLDPPAGARKLARSRRSRVRQPGAIKGRLLCGVCSGFRTEQWKPGKDLQLHHLTRYEHGDGDGDDLDRTVDVGYHAARFGSAEATVFGAQTQLDLIRVDSVDVKVDGHHRGAGGVEPVEQWRAGGP